MALFKCIRSGNIVEFRNDYDIEAMRKHPEYTEVDTSAQVEVENEDGKRQIITLKKPLGRPRKVLA